MKKSLLYIWMLPLLIFSIAVVDVRAQSTTIGVEPDSMVDPGLGPGSTFTAEIWVRDVADLVGVDFKLGYDTTVLTATLIEYGGIFGDNYFPLKSDIYDDEGYVWYGFMEAFGEPSFNGDERAAIITFSVDSLGDSALNLYDTKLGDPSSPPVPISHDALDGFFSNKALVNDVAVTNVIAYPTEVEASELVTVNVTVTNEGNYSETFTVTVYADVIAYELVYDPVTGALVENRTVVGDEITVGTQPVTDLAPGNTTIATFTWNTTDVEAGNYTMSANATLLDDDLRDNLFIDGVVIVTAVPDHDIAITSVTVNATEVNVGNFVTIIVTVTNQGKYNETFSVAVYYDGTEIANQTGITLANGTSTPLSFTWDTTGVAKGTYTISANASVVPHETDKADNTYTDGEVIVGRAASAPNILIFAAVAAAVIAIIAAAAVIYIVKIVK